METRARELTINDYLRIFTSRKLLIVVPALVFLLAAVATAFLLPPRYQTKTLFLLKDRRFLTEIYGPALANVPFESRLGTIQEDIKSYSNVSAVMKDLGLDADVVSESSKDELVGKFRDELEVTLTPAKVGDQQIELTFQHKDPVVAYKFVNAVRDEYTKWNQNKFKDQFKNYLDRLSLQIRETEAELKTSSDRMLDFEKNKPELNTNLVDVRARITTSQKALKTADLELQAMRQHIADAQQSLETEPKFVEQKSDRVNPQKQEAFDRLSKLKQEIEDLDKSYSDLYPPLKKKKEEYEKLKKDFAAIPDRLPGDHNLLENPKYAELTRDLADSKDKLQLKETKRGEMEKDYLADLSLQASLPGLTKQRDELRMNRDRLSGQLGVLKQEQDKGEIAWEAAKEASAGLYETLEAARLPRAPVFPNKVLFAAIGLGLGAGAGLALALLLEISRQTFGSVEEAKNALKIPVMGAINVIRSEMDVARARRRRAMAAMLILVVLLSSLAFAIVYVEFPDYLPDFVRDHLSSLRDRLR
ncbi:MAG: hypothetical protein HYR85_21555 [Planctomycetes bacterium]|nr:hypothetical protein [Planctomycetota bacterium]MBI3845872.1 hypothetical protein [Planctomycetota bacterium]